MKKGLLIITQTVNQEDSNLGFFCEWLEALAKEVEAVYVIAQRVGTFALPPGVTVVSLGAEQGRGRLGQLLVFWRFLFTYLPRVQGVLVHMCPEYVLYGAWLARVYRRRLGLWYLHPAASWRLKLAAPLVHNLFTAYPGGIPIPSNKVVVTGHGINGARFIFRERRPPLEQAPLKLLTVGRISPSKDLLFLIKLVKLLSSSRAGGARLTIVGAPYLPSDQEYWQTLRRVVLAEGIEGLVVFNGPVSHGRLYPYYAAADLLVSAARTGLDKAVLEAIFTGLPVVTSNPAFTTMLPPTSRFSAGDLVAAAEKVRRFPLADYLLVAERIRAEHSLPVTVKKICSQLVPS